MIQVSNAGGPDPGPAHFSREVWGPTEELVAGNAYSTRYAGRLALAMAVSYLVIDIAVPGSAPTTVQVLLDDAVVVEQVVTGKRARLRAADLPEQFRTLTDLGDINVRISQSPAGYASKARGLQLTIIGEWILPED